MPGLEPGIHAVDAEREARHGRIKSGHDGGREDGDSFILLRSLSIIRL